MKMLSNSLSLVFGGILAACSPAAPPPEPPTITGLENGSFTANLNGFDIHAQSRPIWLITIVVALGCAR